MGAKETSAFTAEAQSTQRREFFASGSRPDNGHWIGTRKEERAEGIGVFSRNPRSSVAKIPSPLYFRNAIAYPTDIVQGQFVVDR
jgi:hypothetical protein